MALKFSRIKKNLRETIAINVWVLRLYFSISPLYNSLYIVSQILLSLSPLINSFLLGRAIDQMIHLRSTQAQVSEFLIIFLPLIVSQLIFSLLGMANGFASRMLGTREMLSLQKILANKLVNLGVENLENPEVTNQTHRFKENMGNFRAQGENIIRLISQFITLISTGAIIVTIVPILIPIVIVSSIFEWVVDQHFLRKIWKYNLDSTQERRRASETISVVAEPVSLKELTITNGVPFMMRKFDKFFHEYTHQNFLLRRGWYTFLTGNEFMQSVVYAISLFFVFLKFIANSISVGQLTFLIRTVTSFSDVLTNFGANIVSIREMTFRFTDAKDLFDREEVLTNGHIDLKEDTPPLIEYKNVSFMYPGSTTSIFENLNLTIKPGEKIAIVGENGAGKSTLVKLLSRFYKVNGGSVELSGTNINDVNINSWYRLIGVLFQDYNLYGFLTLSENVRIGATEKTFSAKEIKNSLTEAQADFYKNFPNKLKQVLSERYKGGTRPSTGQWQKIAIARFFYRNAPVLILDEPTASIDAVSEAQIFDNIYKLMKGKTVIIISHRFSTVRNADRILVLKQGKIVEEGSHEQLLKQNGTYAHAFKLQAKGYA